MTETDAGEVERLWARAAQVRYYATFFRHHPVSEDLSAYAQELEAKAQRIGSPAETSYRSAASRPVPFGRSVFHTGSQAFRPRGRACRP